MKMICRHVEEKSLVTIRRELDEGDWRVVIVDQCLQALTWTKHLMNEEKKQSPQDILKLPQDINDTNIIPRRVISIFHLKQCPKSCRVHHSYCSQSSSHPYRIASQSTKFKIKENNPFHVLILIIQIHFYCTQR